MNSFLKLLYILGFGFAGILNLRSQSCVTKNIAFKTGEKLTYVISYNWFIVWTEVGEVNLKIEESEYNENPTYLVTGLGSTYTGWDWFFKVRDTFQCHIETKALKPLFFSRKIKEGGYSQYESVEFIQTSDKAITKRRAQNYPWDYDTINIGQCVFDVLSAYLYARNIDYSKVSKNQTFPLTILLDQELYNITFKYLGLENVKIKNLGTFECLKFSLQLIEGTVFEEGDTMFLWVTNDKNHLPVYIESPIIVGTIKAHISKVINNRHPFTSLVK